MSKERERENDLETAPRKAQYGPIYTDKPKKACRIKWIQGHDDIITEGQWRLGKEVAHTLEIHVQYEAEIEFTLI
jgi:hypothetical protein